MRAGISFCGKRKIDDARGPNQLNGGCKILPHDNRHPRIDETEIADLERPQLHPCAECVERAESQEARAHKPRCMFANREVT